MWTERKEKERGKVCVCVRARVHPLILLQLVETHLLTAAHLIPLLSTGKRVFSLSLYLSLSFSFILSARVLVHFGSCLRPVQGWREKRREIVDALLIRKPRLERKEEGVAREEELFEEIKRTEGIMWTHPFPDPLSPFSLNPTPVPPVSLPLSLPPLTPQLFHVSVKCQSAGCLESRHGFF